MDDEASAIPSPAGRGRAAGAARVRGDSPRATRFEYSAGGVAEKDGALLMILVENLEGERVWTFPKGHIEKGEKPEDTARREVEEETGWLCEITAPLERVQYWFAREGALTKKTVSWYRMKPLRRTGDHDAEEILEARWVPLDEAKKLVKYRSDKQLLRALSFPPVVRGESPDNK